MALNYSGLAAIMADLHTLATARDYPIERVIIERGIKLRGRVEQVGPCPRCGGRDRFSVNTRKRVWNCRGCGVGGDAIRLVQFLDGCNFLDACTTLTSERPQRDLKCEPQFDTDDYESEQRHKARYLYRSSVAATGTPVEKYLRSRAINSPLPNTVRFLPANRPGHHSAMLVPYGLPNEPEPGVLDVAADAITAVQLTLLKLDGTGKADANPNKITIASPAGMPMVLAPVNGLLGLAICEGVEDAMSVHRATGIGSWASGGASFMPKLSRRVPDYVEAVIIFAHDDDAGQRGARNLADALVTRDIEVFVDGVAL